MTTQNNKPQVKLCSIQILRGLAVLLVILLHIYAFETKAGLGPRLLPYFSVFGSSGVDLFFVISGFVMVHTTRPQSKNRLLPFLYRRASRIYPLYWFYILLLILGHKILPQLSERSNLNEASLIQSILLLPQKGEPLLNVAWTLSHELYFYLVFAFCLLLGEKLRKVGLIIWAICIAMSSTTVLASSSPLMTLITNPLTLEFIFGCFVAYLIIEKKTACSTRNSLTVLSCGILLLISAWFLYHLNYENGLTLWGRALILGVPYSLICYGAISLEGQFSKKNSVSILKTLLVRIGDASYSIYLSHFLVISAFTKILNKFFKTSTFVGEHYIDNLLFVASCFILSIAFGLFSYHYIEKPLLRASKLLTKRN